MKRKVFIIVVAVILAAITLKSFLSPPSFHRIIGSNVVMQGPTGSAFRVPLTWSEKVRLMLNCFLSRECNEEELAVATAEEKAQNVVFVNYGSESEETQVVLYYYPTKNLTVMCFNNGNELNSSFWTVKGSFAKTLASRWRSEFDQRPQP